MRSKICEDGNRRIIAKVIVPMGTQEIALFAMANPIFHGNEDAMNVFENLNKRQLFNIAKESISLRGDNVAIADDIATENWTPRQIVRAFDHVRRLFPEVD